MSLDFKGVMVSSTFTDLKEHRAALSKIINGAGFKAVAMEDDFSKSDVDVIDSSLRMVQDSSAYILVISHKYGQTPECLRRNPDGLSITELEFNEAQDQERPILLFIMSDDHAITINDVEMDPEKAVKLKAFRERAKRVRQDSNLHRVYAEFNSLEEFKDKAAKAIFDLRLVLQKSDSRPLGVKETEQLADTSQKKSAERYQAILKRELGYIRMLGMPGVESIKVNLNDETFVPLRMSDRQEGGNRILKESDQQGCEHLLYPDELMKRAFHDRRGRRMLLVIGDPGAGKTTLLKYYALCALENYKRLGFSEPVNVFYLPLRDLVRNKEGNVTDTLPETLAGWAGKYHYALASRFFDESLQSACSLVLLDGLDEISNVAERKEVCRWIDHAFCGLSKAYFVVTSRATGYRKDEGIELESDYEQAVVQDFTPEQQERFLRNWFTAAYLKEPCEKDADEAVWQERQKQEAKTRTETIVAHLKIEKNKALRQLAAIPMILQIMAILWKDREYIPENRVELYEAALNYLLEFRDKRRNIKPLLSATDARQVLGPVSLWMQETIKKDEAARAAMHIAMREWLKTLNTPLTIPTAEDFCDYLVKRAGLLVDACGKEYLFRHKSFREYLAGVQLKEDRPYEHIKTLVNNFGDDWWEEPLRFFIASVDANVFDSFMQQFFDSPKSESLSPKQQQLLLTIIEEAKGIKIDALCSKLLDKTTTISRQRVILDCLKAINKPAALNALLTFRENKYTSENKDVASRAEEVIFALGGQPLPRSTEQSTTGKPLSYRNPNEQNAEYLLIRAGSYLYSVTEKEEQVADLYVAKYPVTNKLYRVFIDSLQQKESATELLSEKLNTIANNTAWGTDFGNYLQKGKNDLATLFRSRHDEDRKFGGEDQPVVGITWYAAQAYGLWLSLYEPDKPPYRLPTEREWEWAAGGKHGSSAEKVRQYPWSAEKGEPTSKLANYAEMIGATTPVGNYPDGVTPEGLYDMAGNVWEWMENIHEKYASARSLRGGSWYAKPEDLRCSARFADYPGGRLSYVGFRVVRSSHFFLPEILEF
jgi:formylglycine-generating enzyme required for sulfatase activity